MNLGVDACHLTGPVSRYSGNMGCLVKSMCVLALIWANAIADEPLELQQIKEAREGFPSVEPPALTCTPPMLCVESGECRVPGEYERIVPDQ